MLRAYRYRMYPTKNQEEMVNKHLGACRYVYN
ncbi:helix-turn-helix domain-containing protein [Methanobacterium spitsbergense]